MAGNLMAGLIDWLFNNQNANGNNRGDAINGDDGKDGSDGHSGQTGGNNRIDDETTDVPIWVMSRTRNNTNSPLYRIPNDIAVLIYAQLDENTKHILRQTSSMFRNTLVPSKTTDEQIPLWHHKYHQGIFYGRQLGPVYALPDNSESRRELTELLKRDNVGYCTPCRDFRASGGFSRTLQHEMSKRELHCNGCNKMHNHLLFSAEHQALKDDASRICIGRQGRIEVCRHGLGFGWFDAWAERTDASCWLWQHWAPARCMFSRMLGANNSEFGIDMSVFSPRVSVQQPRLRHQFFGWDIHLFDYGSSSPPMTRRRLAQIIAEALSSDNEKEENETKTDSEGAHKESWGSLSSVRFCPHVEADDIGRLLMLPFTVNQCACFDHEEDQETVTAAIANAKTHHNHGRYNLSDSIPCCRCSSLASDHKGGTSFLSRTEKETSDRGREPLLAPHRYTCRQCPAVYSWVCRANCVSLCYENRIFLSTSHGQYDPTNCGWLRALDPASWDVQASKKLERVTWCKDTKCATTSNWYKLLPREDAIGGDTLPASSAYSSELFYRSLS